MDSSGHNSAVRATQKLYRTSFVARAARATSTVSFPDRVSHPVDRPRPFLHVLRSAQNGQSPEHSESAMHELESESILVCPTWALLESVRITVSENV